MTAPGPRRTLLPRRHEWGVLVAMVVVLVALLGTGSLASVVGAVVVVAVLRALFPVTASPEPSRVRPWALAVLVVVVLGEMARASATVAWLALRPGRAPPVTAVVAVGLRTPSEMVAVTTSMIITLLPGSLLVDLDVPTATLYVHALGGSDPVAGAVAQARRVEALVARALGHDLADEPVGAEDPAGADGPAHPSSPASPPDGPGPGASR